MPDESLHQPHDKLFRATFSNPENAAAFLRHHLDAPHPPLSIGTPFPSIPIPSSTPG